MNGSRFNSSHINGNGHRYNSNRMPHPPRTSNNTQHFTQHSTQHDDLIKFIYESWHRVSQEVDRNSGQSATYYREQEPICLKNFEPFNLEAYWGQRSLQQMHTMQNYHHGKR